ncbi:hypothetical protein ABT369_18200 [Dactylosporangium sp. NPDC000244]|uniref:hypothetical protein n=1 Tax=Dactylosporangium sp. NPDC000244 TaxID=3154365 RepID=UPI0033266F0E
MQSWLDLVVRRRKSPAVVREQKVGRDVSQASGRRAGIGRMRRLGTAALVGVALAATAAVVQAGPASAEYQGVKWFKNKATGRCLEAGNVAIYDGECGRDSRYQMWEPIYIKKDGNHIVALANHASRLCIIYLEGSFRMESCKNLTADKAASWVSWKAMGASWADVVLQSYWTTKNDPGNKLCLDGNHRVEMKSCNTNSAYQHWSFIKV